MAQEIERKYLVTGNEWRRDAGTRIDIVQAYLAIGEGVQVRVRIIDGARAALTVKAGAPGLVRDEYEYAIPLADAQAMLALRTGSLIEKTRTVILRDGLVWEIDAFRGAHEGLVLAEVEVGDAARDVPLPSWIGREVTGDARYYNAVLARNRLSEDAI
ncbi:MAG: CYTH domain-containing protein [Alphaproteobacteria bacterium]|nr:CYTH domain-containing protein [Alphaproteobacteria bacterium]